MNQYTEMYAWIRHSFGDAPFSIDSFRSVFPTSQAPKVIHDLVREGYLHRTDRGVYRAVKPHELVDGIVQRDYKAKDILRQSEKKYAYCESTAVSIWTEGYYWTGFTKGFKPSHIKVRQRDLPHWQDFFERHHVRFALYDESKTLFGYVYILHPARDFRVANKDGSWAVPLEEIVEFCLENEMSYQPALEYLDEHYGIGYKQRAFIHT
ncbi:hypothetical protein HYR54_15275 [Candidatus Acetothermia bacterium]|nr:hypothetical protein [Candidatus Acetothermia bacterium]